jgi:ABC-type nitrate/sulfonate/bicarbonate transport system substrate-binding protein
MTRKNHSSCHSALLGFLAATLLSLSFFSAATAQQPPSKIRIANANLSVTALPLVAAREWKFFADSGLQVEIIMMNPSISAPALMAGEIDYVAGVGPGSVAATLSGLPVRAVWFSANRISYWVMAAPQFKVIQDLKGKKIGITGGVGGTNHVALLVALEKLGANPKDYTILPCPAPNCFAHWNRALSMPLRLIHRCCSSPRKRASTELSTSRLWWKCPEGA